MNKFNRRQFLSTGALGIGAAIFASGSTLESLANRSTIPAKMPIGFQTWSVRELLSKDFSGTLRMMAGLGYQTLEMCSPPSYSDNGFGGLVKYTGKQLQQMVNDAGLSMISTHYGFDELKNNLDDRIRFAKDSGQKQMILSSFGLPEKASLADWQKAADELNKIGEKVKKEGIQMGYHNHDGEFATLDGTLLYEALMKAFDPAFIKMQFQVAVIRLGYKASTYFEKYPGRFISSHLADWSPQANKQVNLGQGIVNWKEFMAALPIGGVQNIFVEMELDTMKDSVSYLHSL